MAAKRKPVKVEALNPRYAGAVPEKGGAGLDEAQR